MTRSILLLGVLVLGALPAQAQRAKVGIVPFTDKVGINTATTDTLVDMLTTALTKSQKFEVVERNALERLVAEQNFGASGAVDPNSAARMGKMSGADYLVIGVITEAGASVNATAAYGVVTQQSAVTFAIDLRFVDSETGATKLAETFRETRTGFSIDGAGSETFSLSVGPGGEMARALIDNITEKIAISVYPPKVVKVNGDTGECILNYGEAVFEPGDIWDTYTQGEALVDPDTGESLGMAESKTGSIEIISADLKTSQARIVSGTVSQGDACKFPKSVKKRNSGGGATRQKVDPF
jgi:curli biogenesis system outer membrane secretion channel CsgG